MIALIVLAFAVPLLLGYAWLVRATVRHVMRKTGSNWLATLAVVGIFAFTFGDTIINRWYHKEVLCKRDDVGGKVFDRVKLSSEMWDLRNDWPKFPTTMSKEKPFLGRYARLEKYERGGWFPLTAYERYESTVVDLQTEKTLSRFVDYTPLGGSWWALPLALFGEKTIIGWLFSRGGLTSCFDHPVPGNTVRSTFEK